MATSDLCACGQRQTMTHSVDTHPLAKFEGGLQSLDVAGMITQQCCDCSIRKMKWNECVALYPRFKPVN